MTCDVSDDGARAAYAVSILSDNLARYWAARVPLLLEEAVADCADGCPDLQLLYPEERAELARDALLTALRRRGGLR
jgi:hypothetical protein